MASRPPCRLYLISPPVISAIDAFAETLAAALKAGDVASFQLRLKGRPDAELLSVGKRLVSLVQDAGVAFIVNDRPDLARQLNADGVHVGQGDTPVKQARDIVGDDAIVGATCHDSRHLAMEAAERGADYVAFGAFFPTLTKDTTARPALDLLTWWQEVMEIPCVAIGGITVENAEPLVRAGADFLAVSSGVWGHPEGPQKAVAQFTALFERVAAGG